MIARSDRAQRVAWLESLADAANAAAKVERRALDDEARREYEQGCKPSWGIRDIGTVYARESNDAILVDDEAALLKWVKQRHPEHLEEVIRRSFVEHLRGACMPSGGPNGEVVDKTGEPVPGLRFVAGGVYLGITVRVDPSAKEVFDLAASMALSDAMRGQGSPFAAAMADAAEGAQLLAGETPGHDDTPGGAA